MTLEQEIATYERLKPELLRQHVGKWAVIHGERLFGVYDTFGEALRHKYRNFGDAPTLVRQILEKEPSLFRPGTSEAYRAGQERMRERCAAVATDMNGPRCAEDEEPYAGGEIAAAIRALPPGVAIRNGD